MLTADEIREELIRQLDAGIVKAADVARHLRVRPPRVTEMRNRRRQVQQSEMQPLAEYLHMLDTPFGGNLYGVALIPVKGRLAVGVWVEKGFGAHEGFTEFDVTSQNQSVDGLFAMIADGDAMNVQFPPGTTLICREVAGGEAWLDGGAYVVICRERHDLVEYSCKKVERGADGAVTLLNESTNPRYSEALRLSDGVEVIGKVIRAFRSYD